MYFIIETQTFDNGTSVVVLDNGAVPSAADRMAAESIYHLKLSYAAASNLPKHSVALLTEEGFCLMQQCYKHEAAPEAEG